MSRRRRTLPLAAVYDPRLSAARRVLAACALLRNAGCTVVAASAHASPRVLVDRRPRLEWLDAGRKVTAPTRVTFAARLGGIQIEWTERRTA